MTTTIVWDARRLTCSLILLASLSSARADGSSESALVRQGEQAFRAGAFSEAAEAWQRAVEVFQAQGQRPEQVEVSMSLAEAYQALGQQRHAVRILQEALEVAEDTNDSSTLALAKAKLGAALTMTMQTDRAGQLLEEALIASREGTNTVLTAAILNDWGSFLAVQGKTPEALEAFAECTSLAREQADGPLAAKSLCNAAATALQAGNLATARALNVEALREIKQVTPSHGKAFLLLRAGLTELQLHKAIPESEAGSLVSAHQCFEETLSLAEMNRDRATESYALGYLGRAYAKDHQAEAALSCTRRAVFAAQQARLPEALYQWEWQRARLLRADGQIEPAIAAYRRAVETLEPIRNDVSLGYGNALSHPSFREAQGPLFYELADLLFQQASAAREPGAAEKLLHEARKTVEQLKVVELQDYFRDDCVNVQRAKTRGIEAVDARTAVIYLVQLPERVELLVGIASGLTRYTLEIRANEITEEVQTLRRNLETRTTYGYLDQARRLYELLLRPIAGLLKEHAIDTLVFVPDGALRTIPFSALMNGERFMIQDFAVAVAPGLSLVEPRPLRRENVRLLLNGVSESVQGFPSLEFVPSELKHLESLYRSQTLLNEEFKLEVLRRKLIEEQYSIVHIASHGQFARDVRETFVLTYDSRLTLNDLEALIRPAQYRGRPVELLVLSACQTAAGDDRAALGLAGVAVKAGARSALATLWFVNDASTSALVSELYSQLQSSPTVSKARALQAAQIKLLQDRRYRHPCYWSPYLIIGNWL